MAAKQLARLAARKAASKAVKAAAPAETVDAEAKDLATKPLAQLAARKAAKKAAEATPAAVKPKHAPAPPAKTPEQLRDRVRAGLLRRR
jgi:hypothetical protein